MRVCIGCGVGLFIRAAAVLSLTATWVLFFSRSTRVVLVIILSWNLLAFHREPALILQRGRSRIVLGLDKCSKLRLVFRRLHGIAVGTIPRTFPRRAGPSSGPAAILLQVLLPDVPGTVACETPSAENDLDFFVGHVKKVAPVRPSTMLHERPASAEGKVGPLSELHNWRYHHNGPRGWVMPLQVRVSATFEPHQAKEIPQASQTHLLLRCWLLRQMW